MPTLFAASTSLTVAIWLDYCDMTRHRYSVLGECKNAWKGVPI